MNTLEAGGSFMMYLHQFCLSGWIWEGEVWDYFWGSEYPDQCFDDQRKNGNCYTNKE
jgi:hypothetical protein